MNRKFLLGRTIGVTVLFLSILTVLTACKQKPSKGLAGLDTKCIRPWQPTPDMAHRFHYGADPASSFSMTTRIKRHNKIDGISKTLILAKIPMDTDHTVRETYELSDFILDTKHWNYELPMLDKPRQLVRSVEGLKPGVLPNLKPGKTVTLKLMNYAYLNGQRHEKGKSLQTKIKLVGCEKKKIAGRLRSVRVYDLHYPIYTLDRNGHERIRPWHQKITLDEKTGIMLIKTIYHEDGKIDNTTLLLKEEKLY